MAQLQVRDLSLRFGAVTALDRISLEVQPGEIFSIIGPNGAGKTSLLNCISRIYTPSSGRLLFDDRDITRLPRHRHVPLVARTGRVPLACAPSSHTFALSEALSALNNVSLGGPAPSPPGLWAAAAFTGPARRDEARNRRVCEEAIDFLSLEAYRHQ